MSEYQPTTLRPSRSVPIRTRARILAETEWHTARGDWMRFTVWETRGGAYITVREGEVPGKPDQIDRVVDVIEPIVDDAGERDETAMQIAVIEAFDGHDRAKAMVKRELGWAPYVEVA